MKTHVEHFHFAGASRVSNRPSLVIFAAFALVSGCGTTDAAAPLLPTGPTGRLRFVNLTFDGDTTRGKLNAILEGKPFGVDIAYGRSTPAFLPAPATSIYSSVYVGSRSLVLKRTSDSSVTVATVPLSISSGVDYTIYATGASPVSSFITIDTNSAPIPGQARIRIVQMAPSAGIVDVFVTSVGADLSVASITLASLPYKGSAYLQPVAAGAYQVRVVPAGTLPSQRAMNILLNLSTVTIAANSARTIIAADNNSGGAPLRFIALTDR